MSPVSPSIVISGVFAITELIKELKGLIINPGKEVEREKKQAEIFEKITSEIEKNEKNIRKLTSWLYIVCTAIFIEFIMLVVVITKAINKI